MRSSRERKNHYDCDLRASLRICLAPITVRPALKISALTGEALVSAKTAWNSRSKLVEHGNQLLGERSRRDRQHSTPSTSESQTRFLQFWIGERNGDHSRNIRLLADLEREAQTIATAREHL